MHTMIQYLSNPAYLSLLFIGGSVILILAALPLLMNRIKPNHFYGFRVPQTLSNERVWYLANSYAAKWMILTGIITIVVAMVLRLTDVPPEMYQWLCTFTLVGGLVLTTIISLIYAKRIS